VTTPEKQQTTTSSTGNTVVGTNNTTSTSNTTQQTATTSTNNMVTTNNTTTTTTTPVKEVKKLTSLFSPNKTHSITVRFNEGGKIDSADDVTMGQGYSGTEKVTKISDDGKGFTFTTAAGVAYIVSGLDAAGSSYQTTKVVSTVTNTTTTNTTKDTTTTELFSPNKTHSIKVELDKAGKIVSAALSQGYKTTDKVKNISSDGKSFVFTNTAGADYTITPNLATSTYDTMKN
jgi:hypothetical protein